MERTLGFAIGMVLMFAAPLDAQRKVQTEKTAPPTTSHSGTPMTKQTLLNDCADRVSATGLPELDAARRPNTAYFRALRVCFKDRYGLSDSVATSLGAEWMLWQLAFELVRLGGSSRSADSLLMVLKSDTVWVTRTP
jgi:hypothetical protein